jgi:hypothetical protein
MRVSVDALKAGSGALLVSIGTACGPDPDMRAACDAYIACAKHYADTFDVDEPNTSDYEEGGLCDSDPDVGEVCAAQCSDHRGALAGALTTAGEEEGPCED